MAKKRQHIVPKVYLQPFLDHTRPEGWPEDTPFEPGVWVLDPELKKKPSRRSPSNILWKSYFYNLRSDDPDRPWIEESLGRLESAYKPVQAAIINRNGLSEEQYGILCLFIGALAGRVPQSIDHWQGMLDQIQHFYRQMASQEVADEFWAGADEGGKKSVLPRAVSYANVVGGTGFLLVNESPLEFITSDQPVTHTFAHIDESPVAVFPDDLRVNVGTSEQAFFSFVPLTPDTAFVSSPLLDNGSRLWALTRDVQLVFALNQQTRHRAEELLVARSPRPYGLLTELVVAAEASHRAAYRPKTGIQVKTRNERFWISASQIEYGMGAHPLNGRISFVANSQVELRAATADPALVEVLIIKDDRETGGMRDGWFSAVGLVEGAKTVIENGPGGWGAWTAAQENRSARR
jgi:Protein of unknown function (DUF4238)